METAKNTKFDVTTNVLPKFQVLLIPERRDQHHAEIAARTLEAVFDNIIAGPCTEDGGKTWGVYFERVDIEGV